MWARFTMYLTMFMVITLKSCFGEPIESCGNTLLNLKNGEHLPKLISYYYVRIWSRFLEDIWLNIIFAVSIFSLSYGFYILFRPICRVKTWSDIGWSCFGLNTPSKLSGRERAEFLREVQRRRKIGSMPPVYPNGWFALAESKFIRKEQVKFVEAVGESLAIFRSSDGEVHVLDAFCPHLGVNMAVGGIVRGCALECPFHGWKYDGLTGQCTSIPYSKKDPPDFAFVRSWKSREINGFVFFWYDAEGREHDWEIPEIEEITSGQYVYRGRTEHDVLCHIQEIPENGADLAHLGYLHVPNVMKGADLTKVLRKSRILDLANHEWEGRWESLDGEKSHMANVKIKHALKLFNGLFTLLSMTVHVEQIGPSIVHLHFDTIFGKGILIQTVTPIEPLRQKLVHQFYSSRTLLQPIASIMILGEAFHVERDIMIWNSKRYLTKPLLIAEDRLIAKFRRWYQKFYSENSPTYDSCKQQRFEW